jgi:hypothetical protein
MDKAVSIALDRLNAYHLDAEFVRIFPKKSFESMSEYVSDVGENQRTFSACLTISASVF